MEMIPAGSFAGAVAAIDCYGYSESLKASPAPATVAILRQQPT